MSILRPKMTIDSIYNLKVADLKRRGIRAVFSDLDNTLLAWDKKDSIKVMGDLNRRLAAGGIDLVVISNNNHDRIAKVLDPDGIKFIARAKKPLPGGIFRALKQFNLKPDEVIMVGDQLITDIQAANLAGVKSVLVKPLIKTDAWNTSINRFLEKFIFLFLNLNPKKRVKFSDELRGE